MLLPKQLDPDLFLHELRNDMIGIVNVNTNDNAHEFCEQTANGLKPIKPTRYPNMPAVHAMQNMPCLQNYSWVVLIPNLLLKKREMGCNC